MHTADNLRVYRDPEASVVVLESEVHGESALTGRPYNNHFAFIITIKDRRVTHWPFGHPEWWYITLFRAPLEHADGPADACGPPPRTP